MSCSPLYTKRRTGGVAAFQKPHMSFEDQQRPLESDMKITSSVAAERKKTKTSSLKSGSLRASKLDFKVLIRYVKSIMCMPVVY